jgi:hypothetical protein
VEVTELVERPLDQLEVGVAALTDGGDLLLAGLLASLDLRVLGAVGLQPGDVLLQALEAAVDVKVARPLDLGQLLGQFGLEVGQVGVALVLVYECDQVGREVDDLLLALSSSRASVPMSR